LKVGEKDCGCEKKRKKKIGETWIRADPKGTEVREKKGGGGGHRSLPSEKYRTLGYKIREEKTGKWRETGEEGNGCT